MSPSSDATGVAAREPVVLEAETPGGPARLHVLVPGDLRTPVGTIALGHGAGGGIAARDLQAVARAAVRGGWRAVLVEQPWKVAGRKVAVAPPKLDEAWLAALGALPPVEGPLVLGGRSAGARVACRTAAPLGAAGVVCLAFPLHWPGRPEKSRAAELELVPEGVPLLVVQGENDAFGRPGEVAAVVGAERVVAVPGDHSLKTVGPVTAVVAPWLGFLLGAPDADRA